MTHTLITRTQHQYINVNCRCINVCALMCRRPDGVNNGKITVHDIRARIFILKKLHNNTVGTQTNATSNYIRNTHGQTNWIQTHSTKYITVSHLTCVFGIFFAVFGWLTWIFSFNTASCSFHPKRYIRFKRLVLCVVRNRATLSYTKIKTRIPLSNFMCES